MEADATTSELPLTSTIQQTVNFFRHTVTAPVQTENTISLATAIEEVTGPPLLATIRDGPDWDSHRTTLTLTACVALLIAVCGFAGNVLTIIALTSNKGPPAKLRKNASNLFIVSLSLADLMFSAVNMPFAASRFFHREWIHGDFLCRLFPFFRYMNVGLSLLSITAITINRYILIGHRRLYDRIYRQQAIYLMIGFTWIFPIVVLVPTWFGRWGTFGYDPTILNCSILEVNGRSPKYFLFVSAFLVPCFTIIVCYARIFFIVHRSKVKMTSHARTTEQSREREARRRAEEWKVTKMVLIIFCSFLVCYLPITVAKVADRGVRYPGVHLLAYTLVYLSACLNPIIYGVTNQQYRDAYKYTIARLCEFIASGCLHCGQCFVLTCRHERNNSVHDPEAEGQKQERRQPDEDRTGSKVSAHYLHVVFVF
ncbi:G-protein coupled receptor moody-like isoform X3 [Varroa jacobsoni]|uniref:G-protein coupled receptor moody-like isoform X3 n=1 Tax=Varroa jacobsoni TaxID=62625 RepID=UPI000BF8538D|nr:G-protein coupled receptor moody-like isoform X3 [Varroa jacobsoni]